jgi:carboxymethylenebutenolidase
MGEWIHLTASDGHGFNAYAAQPRKTTRGSLVLVQEIFGVNSHIRGVADSFAEEGFHVLAPCYFDRVEPGIELGYQPDDVARGRELKAEVGYENALRDTGAAVARLISEGHSVGVVGYCWGGDISWLTGADLPVDCSVCYYGGGIVNLLDHKPRVPLQLHFGEEDHAIPLEAVKKIHAAVPEAELYLYPAGHGFNCDQRGSYDAKSAATARARCLDFLDSNLD